MDDERVQTLLRELFDEGGRDVPPRPPMPKKTRWEGLRWSLPVAGAALAVAAVVVGGHFLVDAFQGSSPRPVTAPPTASSGPTPSPKASSTPTPSPHPTFAPLTAPAWAALAPAGDVLGFVGAGNERLAVLNGEDGQVLNYLQGSGSQSILVRFGGGNALIQQIQTSLGCTYVHQTIDAATGAGKAALTSLPEAAEIGQGSTEQRLVYSAHQPAHATGGKIQLPDGSFVNDTVSCGASALDLVVYDTRTGAKRRWIGSSDNALYPALDNSSTRVAFKLGGQVHILDVNGSEQRLDQAPVLTLQAGCQAAYFRFQPASRDILWVAEQCASGEFIAAYNVATGQETQSHLVSTAGGDTSFTGIPDVDPNGRVIGTIGSTPWAEAGTDGRVFIADASGVRLLPTSGVYAAFW
jgi:hypothetical protein